MNTIDTQGDATVDPRRQLPAVSRLLETEAVRALVALHGRIATVAAVQRTLGKAREALRNGAAAAPDETAIVSQIEAALEAEARRALQGVINATGVVIHTNLGRVSLSEAAQEAMRAVATGYSNLEYRLDAGTRGGRGEYVEAMLRDLTGAEAALVVNNAASAVLLTLTALAKGGEVVISRGQLVEIGGGFRIPEVMAQSGAHLVEVGTTNRTRRSDYEAAITDATRVIFVAHRSNFRIIGFHEEPTLDELAALAHGRGLPLVHDVGSGALLDTAAYGLTHEPMPQESIAAGADLVIFSGDKLLGGPQAGCIVGRADLVTNLRRHPLARAVRIDKYCMAGLGATLRHYVEGEAEAAVPVWRMMGRRLNALKAAARRWAEALNARGVRAEARPGFSTVGGGSLPEETLPTFVTALLYDHANRLLDLLRWEKPPVIARVADNRLVLDPRTVLEGQEAALLAAVESAIRKL